MSNPADILSKIDADAARLDELEQAMETATNLLDQAEEAWLETADKVAEDLKDEMREEGRKGDPAAHWVEAQARKSNRVAYTNYRRAERAVKRIKEQLKARQAAMNGRQSELAALRDELRATAYQPGSRHMGARRA